MISLSRRALPIKSLVFVHGLITGYVTMHAGSVVGVALLMGGGFVYGVYSKSRAWVLGAMCAAGVACSLLISYLVQYQAPGPVDGFAVFLLGTFLIMTIAAFIGSCAFRIILKSNSDGDISQSTRDID